MFEIYPFEDKIYFLSVEDKPIKLVFEGDSDKPIMVAAERNSNDHFTREAFDKLVKKVAETSYSNNHQLPFYLTENMVYSETINHPIYKAVNDSVDALVDSWKSFSKSSNSICNEKTLKCIKDVQYWWKIACEDYLKNIEDNRQCEQARKEVEKIAVEKFGVPEDYFNDGKKNIFLIRGKTKMNKLEELIDYLYDMHVSADIKLEELAEDIISIVDSNDDITQ